MPLMTINLYSHGVSAISIPFFRTGFVALLMALVIVIKKQPFIVSRQQLVRLIVAAFFGMCLTPILLYQSYYTIPSGMATTLHFLYPVIVALVAIVYYKQRAHKIKTAALVIAMVGMIFLFEIDIHVKFSGIVFAFLSAVTYAIYIIVVGSAKLKSMNALLVAFYLNLLGMVSIGIIGLPLKVIRFDYAPETWLYLVVFSLLIGILGSVFFQLAVTYIGGQSASILSTFEPITSILVGLVILDERFTVKLFIGMVMILLSALLIVIIESKHKNDNELDSSI